MCKKILTDQDLTEVTGGTIQIPPQETEDFERVPRRPEGSPLRSPFIGVAVPDGSPEQIDWEQLIEG